MTTFHSRFRRKSAAPKKPRKPKTPFDPVAALALADSILAAPAAHERVVRRDPVGRLVDRWILSLETVPGVNSLNGRTAEEKGWARSTCIREMLKQIGKVRPAKPLDGRPHVRVIRFSSREPDGDQAFSKLPLDALQIDKPRRPAHMSEERWAQVKPTLKPKKLGYLADDSPKHIDLFVGWEPAPPKKGCVLVEIWTGVEK